MKILRDVDLKEYNSFGIKAAARKIVAVQSQEDIVRYLNSEEYSEHDIVLGGGSNILFLGDLNQNIIKNDIKGFRVIEDNQDDVLVEVGAGVVWHEFLEECMKHGYYGLENLALIPGTVGAAPVQNIGAYGVEQDVCFESLTGILRDTAEEMKFTKEKCKFEYRNSIFKTRLKGRFIITSVRYRLSKSFSPVLTYRDLKDKFAEKSNFSASELFDYICEVRKSKLPDYKELGNAGSFFKNPIISVEMAERLRNKYEKVPLFDFEDRFKISAAWLIQEAGFKGKRLADAGVSEKHALILVNYGNASGADIYNLSQNIIDVVKDKFDLELEREVNIVGEL